MQKNRKKEILSIFKTMEKAHLAIEKVIGQRKADLTEILSELQNSAFEAGTEMEKEIGEDHEIILLLEAYCEFAWQLNQAKNHSDKKQALKSMKQSLREVTVKVEEDIEEKREVVFLPYKASMWTSLESIWMAAEQDPDCRAIVMPVPYYELDGNGQPKKICYEGDQFPSYVPITHFREYDIEQSHPTMIFFHNPYDGTNTVTYIPEQFHSKKLRNQTDCLVYSPYFTQGGYIKGKTDHWFFLPGVVNCHKMIVQSEKVKKIFVNNYGYDSKKFLVEGSPKMDAIINRGNKPVAMPKTWEKKLAGKEKIFLLNTHMLYFINLANYAQTISSGINYGIQYHREILAAIEKHPECGLIWRPHPLMKAVMNEEYAKEDKYKKSLEFIVEMETRIQNADNCIIDTTADYRTAFNYSDAMISTYSSLVQEYMATGKPVLIFQKKQSDEAAQSAFVDFRSNYFRTLPDAMTFEAYIQMVRAGEDPKYEERIASIRKSFTNLDGTVGKKIYAGICRELES